jgi:prepilin peptidase CpaA
MSASHVFVGIVLTLACIADLRTRRIPNVLTFSAAALAVGYHATTGGWAAVGLSVGGWLLGVALFFPMFALRGMGAGDVKLLATVGAWLGPAQVLLVALASSIAGGVLALGVALFHGYLKKALTNVRTLLTHWRLAGVRPLPEVTLERSEGPRLAYAVPVAIVTVVALWLR